MNQDHRFFNQTQKQALFLVANGKCQECGADLDKSWHADHIKPYSKQGETDVINGQALCSKCNLKKGNRMSLELREWQKDLEREYFEINQRDFLLTALPGAGKTIAALNVGGKLINRNIVDGLIIVVPTEHLKNQWKDDAHKFLNINLFPKFITKADIWPNGFDGLCVTYQQVARGSNIFRKFCAEKRILTIFDEIHHCGDDPDKAWGRELKNAFDYATKRLALTGTPFRSDNHQIPFVRYDDCICYSDFRYDYPQAIHDGVIRIVLFEHYTGDVSWITRNGETKAATFSDELNQIDSKDRLRTALDPSGDYLYSLISEADKKLDELRTEDINAGGLIIAKDTFHAKDILNIIFKEHIQKPVMVTYEDSEASQKIDKFRDSNHKWIIAVNMISEGVDIKRLRVLVYATVTSTMLYFRQAVGRIVRYQKKDDTLSYCFLPSDPILIEYAEKIKELQLHAIESEQEKQKREKKREDGPQEFNSIIPLYSSDARLDLVNIEGQKYHNEMIEKIKPSAQKYNIDPVIVLKILNETDLNPLISKNKMNIENPLIPAKADVVEKLKNKAHKLAYRLSRILKIEPKEVNTEWLRHGGKAHNANDQDDLERKIKWLENEIESARNS